MPDDWLIARTKPCQEQRAAVNLHRQAQRFYLPVVWNSKSKRRQPLFPGYIFICVARGAPFGFLHSTFGIAELICFNGRPATISKYVIKDLKSAENKNGVIRLRGETDTIKKGDRVEVLDGAFRGNFAIYDTTRPGDRVAVLMQLLGHSTRVTLDARDIRRAA